jgi:hypothetical protein
MRVTIIRNIIKQYIEQHGGTLRSRQIEGVIEYIAELENRISILEAKQLDIDLR